jgi:4-aminobutyrate aminotransferase-like enzyme
MAKALGNGYPIGAVLMRDSIAATMTPGPCPSLRRTLHTELSVIQARTERHSVDHPWPAP